MSQAIEYKDGDESVEFAAENDTLDPHDWKEFRVQAHRMLDDILDYTKNIRERPVWQVIPDPVRQRFQSGLPFGPSSLADVHQEFMKYVVPYAVGNVHPGFMGWVHGGGTAVGMLAEMLAARLNSNVGGRDQMPVEVERQITRWMRQLFRFPRSASGLFVAGTSMANFIAVVIARDAALGHEVRAQGVHRLAKFDMEANHGSHEESWANHRLQGLQAHSKITGSAQYNSLNHL